MVHLYKCIIGFWINGFAGTTGTAEGEGEVNNKLGTTFILGYC
jgi:hypothetical protein